MGLRGKDVGRGRCLCTLGSCSSKLVGESLVSALKCEVSCASAAGLVGHSGYLDARDGVYDLPVVATLEEGEKPSSLKRLWFEMLKFC